MEDSDHAVDRSDDHLHLQGDHGGHRLRLLIAATTNAAWQTGPRAGRTGATSGPAAAVSAPSALRRWGTTFARPPRRAPAIGARPLRALLTLWKNPASASLPFAESANLLTASAPLPSCSKSAFPNGSAAWNTEISAEPR